MRIRNFIGTVDRTLYKLGDQIANERNAVLINIEFSRPSNLTYKKMGSAGCGVEHYVRLYISGSPRGTRGRPPEKAFY